MLTKIPTETATRGAGWCLDLWQQCNRQPSTSITSTNEISKWIAQAREGQCRELPFKVKQLLLNVHPPCLGQLYKPKEQFWYDDTDIVYYIYNYMCYSHISSDWDISFQEFQSRIQSPSPSFHSTENSWGGPYSPGTFPHSNSQHWSNCLRVAPRELAVQSVWLTELLWSSEQVWSP